LNEEAEKDTAVSRGSTVRG